MSYIEGYVSEEIFNIDGLSGAKPYSQILAFLWKAMFLRRPVQKIFLDKAAKCDNIYIYISPFIISYFYRIVKKDFYNEFAFFFWFPCNFSYD